MYSNGEYVAQDEEEAAKWLRLAAEQGDTDAQSMFGLMCANGEGVVKNDEEAVEWLLLAAEKGNSCAQASLGLIFGEGLGVIQDSVQAHKWFKVSTVNGDEEEILLAIQYMDALEGEMTPDEIAEAILFFWSSPVKPSMRFINDTFIGLPLQFCLHGTFLLQIVEVLQEQHP